MNDKTKDFQFKQFSVSGGNSGMPISTDGVLLGAWAPLPSEGYLLDIGTGTGLLSLICAQRSTDNLHIVAIEIEKNASETALFNFSQSHWNHRLSLVSDDLLNHPFSCLFDGIICNPPYFINGEQSNRLARANARHTNTLSHKNLLKICQTLLKTSGGANFILPSVEGQAFIVQALDTGWYLHSRCDIKTTERKNPSRMMFRLVKQPCKTETSHLTIHQNGQYSDEFTALTQDFYLKM